MASPHYLLVLSLLLFTCCEARRPPHCGPAMTTDDADLHSKFNSGFSVAEEFIADPNNDNRLRKGYRTYTIHENNLASVDVKCFHDDDLANCKNYLLTTVLPELQVCLWVYGSRNATIIKENLCAAAYGTIASSLSRPLFT